jgi:hypothetical protein
MRTKNLALWTLQALLAALFLFAGGMKLALPIEALTAQSPFPGWFLRFIGAAEVAGALGLILPEALRIRRELTPLAALCLTIIMVGATVTTIPAGASAAIPLAVGVACAVVARGRSRNRVSTPLMTIAEASE